MSPQKRSLLGEKQSKKLEGVKEVGRSARPRREGEREVGEKGSGWGEVEKSR